MGALHNEQANQGASERTTAYDYQTTTESCCDEKAHGHRVDDLGSVVFFGFGLYWAWLWVFEETPVLLAVLNNPMNHVPS